MSDITPLVAGGPGSTGLVSDRISPRAVSRFARVDICEGGIIARRVSLSPVRPPSGSVRGSISGFSVASRGRLIRRLLGLSWGDLIGGKRAKRPRGLFVTLTYPDIFPEAFERWKRDLDTFSKRVGRKWPGLSLLWKMEMKPRKTGVNRGEFAPHFHMIGYIADGVDLAVFRAWVSRAWYEVVGSGDEKHLRAGTQVKRVYGTVAKLMAYCAKYLAKEFDCEQETGRVWGEIGEVPRSSVYTLHVDYPEFVRRVRRACGASGYLRSMSVWRSGFVAFGALAQLTRGIVVSSPPNYDRLANIQTVDRQVIFGIIPFRVRRREQIERERAAGAEVEAKIYGSPL